MKACYGVGLLLITIAMGTGRAEAANMDRILKQQAVKTALLALDCEVEPETMSVMICSVAHEGSWSVPVPCGFDLSSCSGLVPGSTSYPRSKHSLEDALPTSDAPEPSTDVIVKQVPAVTTNKGESFVSKTKKLRATCDGTWVPALWGDALSYPFKEWMAEIQAQYVGMGCTEHPNTTACMNSEYFKHVEVEFSNSTGFKGGGDD